MTVDYNNLPHELDEALEPTPEVVEKTAQVSYDGTQYTVRFPTELAKIMGVKKGDVVVFKMTKPHPKVGGDTTITLEYRKT